jgi:K+-transporting ATPase KdpF subunit
MLQWSKIPLYIFLALCLNVAIAPVIYAANSATIDRFNAYAIGLLGLVVIGLFIYLSLVIIKPEEF